MKQVCNGAPMFFMRYFDSNEKQKRATNNNLRANGVLSGHIKNLVVQLLNCSSQEL
jgi:hypothetical protein